MVNPGGQAQVPHADYHLGFVVADRVSRYPAHIRHLSPALTLQGAVAHCNMPIETGPTLYLPYSQRFEGGYGAFGRPEFVEYFHEHRVQLPLGKGDAAFFNPVASPRPRPQRHDLGPADGQPAADTSPFGRAMETLDRETMCNAVFPALLALRADGADERALSNAVVATAEGYPFPTNLDRDQPVDGLAPPSQVDVLWTALTETWSAEALAEALRAQSERRMA